MARGDQCSKNYRHMLQQNILHYRKPNVTRTLTGIISGAFAFNTAHMLSLSVLLSIGKSYINSISYAKLLNLSFQHKFKMADHAKVR